MAVPNTTTFSLQDVVDEVNPTTNDLVDCISDAVTASYNPTYFTAPATSLLEFRDYDNSGGGTNTLSRSPSTLTFGSGASSQSFSVSSNTTWSISDNASWITISGASGSNNDANIICRVSANGTGGFRLGVIVITTTSGTPTRSLTIGVTQSPWLE